MEQKNKIIVIVLAVLLLAAGGIWYGKRQLWKAEPIDAIPIKQKERTPLDLRPAAIAKMQRLVKDGSDSLYKLRIDSLFTEIGSGTIILKGVGLYPDTTEMPRLAKLQKLPDDIFEAKLSSLRITGISLADIINRRDIHLRAIACSGPQIQVHHKLQPYNADKRAAARKESIFSRMKGDIDRLAIDTIAFGSGIVIDQANGVKNTFKEVSLLLNNILIDSASEKDQTRFLFAKTMMLKAGSINIPMSKSQYELSIGDIAIMGDRREVSMRNFSLHPRGGKEAFAKGLGQQQSVFTIDAPVVTLQGANWWAAVHGESLIASEVKATSVSINSYIDRHLPLSPLKRANFPAQLLTSLSTAVSIGRAEIKNALLVYEEFNDKSNKLSSISFDKLNMLMEGVSNVPSEIAARPVAHVQANCLLMNVCPLKADFSLDLPRSKRGGFRANLIIGALDHEIVNPFSEAMGQVRFSSGQLQGGTAQATGNNDNVRGSVSIRYTDLHVEPLKTKEDENGHLKKKHVTKKIANIVFVKNNNPGNIGGLREPEFSLDRTSESNFFSFMWAGLKLGLLKTIGIPPAFGMKK